MPLYEYHCNSCNADFEKIVSSTAPKPVCEKCGSGETEKLLSRFGLGRGSDSGSGASSGSGCGGCSSSSCAGCK